MKFVLSCILGCLFLIIGCSFNKSISADLMINETKNLSVEESCKKPLNERNFDYVAEKVEKESINFTYSESNQTKATAEVLLNPKWIKRLGDDATYFVNYNEQLNEARDSVLKAKIDLINEGFLMSPCEINENGKLFISISNPNASISNFSDLLDSYNVSVQRRNDSYNERLAKFQNDFKGTKFTIKSKEYATGVKPYDLDTTADLSFLQFLYNSRLKELITVQGGKK